MESAGGSGEFLPPEPPGPEPDLAAAPQQPAPAWQEPPQPQGPPPQQPQQGWYQQPPAPGWPPPPWAYPPAPSEPDNGSAVAGFVTSIAAAALLVMSFGFMSAISLIAAPFGIHYSRKGKRAVAEGRTRKHAGLAQAGFVVGIVTLVLSVLAVIGWIVVIIVAANDSQNDPGGGGGFTTSAAAILGGAF